MKKITSFLFFACIASGLLAQSWKSPDLDNLQESYHGRTIIDFHLEVDGNDYASHAGDPVVAAFIGGECRGESKYEVINVDGNQISYHTLTIYGDPTADKNKEVSFRLFDTASGIEYILPQKFTFDGEHHGSLSGLETLSFMSVREIFLSNQNIYPGGVFNLNDYLTLQGQDTEVYDGTQIVVTWSIGDGGSLPEGFDLNPETGILTTSDNAVAGKVNYSVTASGNMSATGTLTLEYSVKEIVILKKEIEIPVGSNINQYVTAGEVYNVLPAAANQNVTITAADANIVDARGNVKSKGTTTLTIASVENPEIKGTLTLKAYIPVEQIEILKQEIELPVGSNIYDYVIAGEVYNVLPAEANQDVVIAGANKEIVDVDGNVIAVGSTTLNIMSVENPKIATTLTLKAYIPVEQIEIIKQEIELPVGSNINQYVTAGEVYNVLPAAANQNVTITAADANIVDARGNVKSKGSTTLTITSEENPEIKGTLTLKAYIPLTGFELREGNEVYENYENIYMDRQNKKTLTLYPVPVGARVDTELLDIYTSSTKENLYADFPYYKVEVEDIEMEYNESDEFEYATFTLHGWSIGVEDLIITYETEDVEGYDYWYPVCVGADFQLTDGWDWVTINDSWFPDPENNSFNYLNGADYFGGGLIDVRSKTGNLYKDPVYGIYGSIEYIDNYSCYKIKFDRSQATLLDNDETFFITYPQKMEVGINPYSYLTKGWTWLAYPFEYDYEFAELEPYFNESDGVDGDIILAADGSMATYSEEDGWIVSDEGFTFRYGKGYLYYTTSDRHLDLYWGEVYSLPQVDLTTTATQAASRNHETIYWEYDAHRFPNKMPIIARLEGIDNPSNYTIGAFVGDECRGEGKTAKQWMFITVNGEANEQITFRLIDKQTGICYDLSESLAFDSMAGSLKEPVCFNAGAVTGIENMISNTLIIQGDVVTASGDIQVYDAQGKLVAEGYQRVDLNHLNQGVYMVKSGDQSRKIVK